jgi:hypothetical protein
MADSARDVANHFKEAPCPDHSRSLVSSWFA